jgi:hypothetical protein
LGLHKVRENFLTDSARIALLHGVSQVILAFLPNVRGELRKLGPNWLARTRTLRSKYFKIQHSLTILLFADRSWDSDWLQARRPMGRISSPGGVKIFLFSTSSRPVLGPIQTRIQRLPGTLSREVKWPGPLTTHLQLVPKNTWIYTSTPPYVLMTHCSII